MPYQDKAFFKRVSKMRDEIEKKLNITLPLLYDLKGNITRLGKFGQHQINLRKGQEFRLFQKKSKLKGTDLYCYCDLGEWFTQLKEGDRIIVGFGNYGMVVKGKETLQEGLIKMGLDQNNETESKYEKSETNSTFSNLSIMPSLHNTNRNLINQSNSNHKEIFSSLSTIAENPTILDESTTDLDSTNSKCKRLTSEQRKNIYNFNYENDIIKESSSPQV